MAENTSKKPFYKKWWVWVIGLFVIFAAIGGANAPKPQKVGETTSPEENSTVTEAAAEPETFKIGDKVKLGDYTLIVNEANPCTTNNQFMKPQVGNKFITVDITQENAGNDPHDYNLWYFKLQDDKDFSYQTSLSNCKDPSFGFGTLQKSQKTRGFITFEIPEANNATKLIFSPSWWSSGDVVIELQ